MIEPDTIKLLRECDAGIKMGTASIADVLDKVNDTKLKEMLENCKDQHQNLQKELESLLEEFHDDGKEPNPMAQGMSWIKTNVMMAVDAGDNTIADLMTDGCNMGVKSLSGYLNNYQAADEKSKNIAKELISLEERLSVDVRDYLSAK